MGCGDSGDTGARSVDDAGIDGARESGASSGAGGSRQSSGGSGGATGGSAGMAVGGTGGSGGGDAGRSAGGTGGSTGPADRCGDGTRQSGEACDDGNADNTDACLDTCTLATCGDGWVQTPELCDDGRSAFMRPSGECAVRQSGIVTCWGSEAAVAEFSNFFAGTSYRAVTVSTFHACGIRHDGTLSCKLLSRQDPAWGGSLVTPPGGRYTRIDSSVYQTCALAEDTHIECWGFDPPAPSATGFTAVSTGHYHVCGLRADGSILCWGNNDSGQSNAPAGTYRSVTAGSLDPSGFSCAVDLAGALRCWGKISVSGASAPVGPFLAADAGPYSLCALREADRRVECWEVTYTGLVALPAGSAPPDVAFEQVGVDVGGACGLDGTGRLRCWAGWASGTPPDPPACDAPCGRPMDGGAEGGTADGGATDSGAAGSGGVAGAGGSPSAGGAGGIGTGGTSGGFDRGCEARPVDEFCVQYVGSLYTAIAVSSACTGQGYTVVPNCTATGTYGRCTYHQGASDEYIAYYYIALSALASTCQNAGGIWQAL